MNPTKKHLPLFGAGPVYVISISIMTLLALALHYLEIIPHPEVSRLSLICSRIAAILLLLSGISLWISAVCKSRLTRNIKENHLITDGVYGIVRHPVYSAFMLAEWGLLLWTANVWLLILLPIYWAFLTVLIRNTEEKWLRDLYGKAYEDYSKNVNRCIPWFSKGF